MVFGNNSAANSKWRDRTRGFYRGEKRDFISELLQGESAYFLSRNFQERVRSELKCIVEMGGDGREVQSCLRGIARIQRSGVGVIGRHFANDADRGQQLCGNRGCWIVVVVAGCRRG